MADRTMPTELSGLEHYDEICVGRLQRADDRREVSRARRVGLVVDDLEAVLLRVLAGAVAGGVCCDAFGTARSTPPT